MTVPCPIHQAGRCSCDDECPACGLRGPYIDVDCEGCWECIDRWREGLME